MKWNKLQQLCAFDAEQSLCYHVYMRKDKLIELLGGTAEKAAKKLGYAHRNSVQRFSDPLTLRQEQTVIMRMRAKRIRFLYDSLV